MLLGDGARSVQSPLGCFRVTSLAEWDDGLGTGGLRLVSVGVACRFLGLRLEGGVCT